MMHLFRITIADAVWFYVSAPTSWRALELLSSGGYDLAIDDDPAASIDVHECDDKELGSRFVDDCDTITLADAWRRCPGEGVIGSSEY